MVVVAAGSYEGVCVALLLVVVADEAAVEEVGASGDVSAIV